MKRISFLCFMMGIIIYMFPAFGGQSDEHPGIKPDFKKMMLQTVKAYEERDFHALGVLMGREPSEEEKSGISNYLDGLEAKGELDFYLSQLSLFPEIKELPEWMTEAKFDVEYLNDNREVHLGAEFVLEDDSWLIKDIDLTEMGKLSDEEKMEWAGSSSPLPPEGKKTIEAGLTELIKKFASDFKEKNWESIMEYAPYDRYTISKLKKKGGDFGDLLSQFPYIGSIPAPARRVEIKFKGTLEGEKNAVEVEFRWKDKKLRIKSIDVYSFD